MKICSKCKITRGFEEFSKDTTKNCGLRSECKQCQSVVKAKNYAKNSEKIKERIYKYSRANYEKVIRYAFLYLNSTPNKRQQLRPKNNILRPGTLAPSVWV